MVVETIRSLWTNHGNHMCYYLGNVIFGQSNKYLDLEISAAEQIRTFISECPRSRTNTGMPAYIEWVRKIHGLAENLT